MNQAKFVGEISVVLGERAINQPILGKNVNISNLRATILRTKCSFERGIMLTIIFS
jgi:hypothetical protein